MQEFVASETLQAYLQASPQVAKDPAPQVSSFGQLAESHCMQLSLALFYCSKNLTKSFKFYAMH